MIITREDNLSNFEFWGGARDRAIILTEKEFKTIEYYMTDIQEQWTETDVNDFIWFE